MVMAICIVCKVKPANDSLEGMYGRPICLDCFADENIRMEREDEGEDVGIEIDDDEEDE